LDNDNIFFQVKELLISEFKLSADSISPEKRLEEDLDLDSLDMVDFLMSFNEQRNKEIDVGLFKNAKTVQDIVDLIRPFWK